MSRGRRLEGVSLSASPCCLEASLSLASLRAVGSGSAERSYTLAARTFSLELCTAPGMLSLVLLSVTLVPP